MTTAVLSLGSNVGDRLGYLRAAVAALHDSLISVSAVYETEPWGDVEQPRYLNAAVLVASPEDDPAHWLEVARKLEADAGRTRDPARRYGPRTLDVDIIAVVSEQGAPVVVDSPDLTVPHPLAHLRAFVLRPWLDLQPQAVLPHWGPIGELLRSASLASELDRLRPYDAGLQGRAT
ncbi:MAG: 2-amino-4-hydroxy-6-hydroxymethyldihydropteridine diphosphokinase [Micromonosporaceae bacterium]|nr:2-amino-4-hydroxy-6-hydroxymethyldihydropteridine diphosphokinase [Micromonosporaceae bacterium]